MCPLPEGFAAPRLLVDDAFTMETFDEALRKLYVAWPSAPRPSDLQGDG